MTDLEKELELPEFESHFTFETIVQTHGRDEEGAIENIERMINPEVMNGIEFVMACGMGFEVDVDKVKEIENGWFELILEWSGSWSINANNETEAREKAKALLEEVLTPFYRILEIEADKRSRFEFKELKNQQVTDVCAY